MITALPLLRFQQEKEKQKRRGINGTPQKTYFKIPKL
jgi:hypothetical protein